MSFGNSGVPQWNPGIPENPGTQQVLQPHVAGWHKTPEGGDGFSFLRDDCAGFRDCLIKTGRTQISNIDSGRTSLLWFMGGSIEHDPVFDNVTPTTDDSHLAEAGVFVLRQYLSEEDQQMFYEGLVSVAQEADVTEIDQLQEAGCPFPAAPFPFLMYNNPTTKSGNISEVPIFALDLAQGAYDSAMAAGEKKGLQSPPQKTMNSCHAQLYPVGGCMAPHKDTGGSWGLSISLGASALFRVDQLVLRLNSGDVVIANFGGRVHSVRLRSPKTAPEWWTNSRFTYGAARCNVQFRCAGDYTGPKEVHIPWSRTAVWLHKLARFLR